MADGWKVCGFASPGKMPRVEVRKMNENGQVVVGNVTEYQVTQSRPGTSGSSGGSSSSDWMTDESERDDDADYAAGSFGDERGAWERNDVPILLYLHEVRTHLTYHD